jgi:LPXTG-motif cell wall-anchored protein
MDPDGRATDMDAERRVDVADIGGIGGRGREIAGRVLKRAAFAVAVTGVAIGSVGSLTSAHAAAGSVSDESAPQADLAISMRSSTSGPYVDRSFDWLLSVTNSGPDAAQSVVVSDVVPASMTLIRVTSDAFECSMSANTVKCTRTELAAGASGPIEIDVMLPPSTTASTVQNSADVSSATADPNPSNNSAGASVQTVVVQIGVPDVVVPDVVVPNLAVRSEVVVPSLAVRSEVVVPNLAVRSTVHPARTSASPSAVPSVLPSTGVAVDDSAVVATLLSVLGAGLMILRRRVHV